MGTVMGTTSASNVIDVDVYARGEDGRGIISTIFEYQAGNSSTTIPTGTWSPDFVTPEQGQYLWTKTTSTYNDDSVLVSYNISYFSVDGGWYTPSVNAAGDLSWTPSKEGLPPVETVNIRGPKGEQGSVKFIYTTELPTEDIQNDAFYILPAANPTSIKTYDEYFYINNGWEKLGDDLTAFYNKDEIDAMIFDVEQTIENFVATLVKIESVENNIDYYLTGMKETSGSDNSSLYKSGLSYRKQAGATKGKGYIDGEQITTNLFFLIS